MPTISGTDYTEDELEMFDMTFHIPKNQLWQEDDRLNLSISRSGNLIISNPAAVTRRIERDSQLCQAPF